MDYNSWEELTNNMFDNHDALFYVRATTREIPLS